VALEQRPPVQTALTLEGPGPGVVRSAGPRGAAVTCWGTPLSRTTSFCCSRSWIRLWMPAKRDKLRTFSAQAPAEPQQERPPSLQQPPLGEQSDDDVDDARAQGDRQAMSPPSVHVGGVAAVASVLGEEEDGCSWPPRSPRRATKGMRRRKQLSFCLGAHLRRQTMASYIRYEPGNCQLLLLSVESGLSFFLFSLHFLLSLGLTLPATLATL